MNSKNKILGVALFSCHSNFKGPLTDATLLFNALNSKKVVVVNYLM